MVKILVVEEGGTAREALGPVFSGIGFEAEYVHSSRVALQRYRDGDYAMVLTEVRLSEMDGLTLARKLRQQDPEAIVICMAAIERRNDLLRAIREGVFDFFVKPFPAGELQASLRRACEVRERRAVTRSASSAVPASEPASSDFAESPDLAEREAALAEREAALERAVEEFEALGMGLGGASAGVGGADAEELAEREAAIAEREASLAEREELLAEREAFLEQSENALFDKGQRLQELETELEHRAEGMDVPLGAGLKPQSEVPADLAAQVDEVERRGRELETRERELEERFGRLLEREKRLKKNEALVKAREQYLRESENILFETEED